MASGAFASGRGGTHPVLAQSFCPTDEQRLVPPLLKDFHLGMVDWLAEVLRETLMGTTVTPRAPVTALSKPAAIGPAARQLTVAELRVTERQPCFCAFCPRRIALRSVSWLPCHCWHTFSLRRVWS